MNRCGSRVCTPVIVGVVGLTMMCAGLFFVTHRVFEEGSEDPEDLFALYEIISEPQMVVNATFGGIVRSENGTLRFTYDPTALLTGSKPCPT